METINQTLLDALTQLIDRLDVNGIINSVTLKDEELIENARKAIESTKEEIHVQQIIEHNAKVNKEITRHVLQFTPLKEEIKRLEKTLKSPCEFCPFDGEYRCESCIESNYEGFNIPDYPNNND